MSKILFINNEGGGFAGDIDIREGQTVENLFKDKFPDRAPSDFLIRVNREAVSGSYVLQDLDRVTMTPIKIDGAIVLGVEWYGTTDSSTGTVCNHFNVGFAEFVVHIRPAA